jgi:DNA-binding transcriptional ArsR family regulator
VDHGVFAALAEPNRLRIVELLNQAPRSVGEVAAELGLRQPQVTKHLQTLQHAGLVTMYPLGQRRIYALQREPLRELENWLDAFDRAHASERLLDRYATAVADERAEAARDPEWATGRRTRMQRTLPAAIAEVWAHWTSPALVRQWWSPEHFTVAECKIDPVPGGRLEITMQEPDGRRYPSRGRFLTVKRTQLNLAIRVTAASPAAAPAIAGIQLGWEQLLNKLTRMLIPAPGPRGVPPTS